MSQMPDHPNYLKTSIFNGFICTSAIFALSELGFFELTRHGKTVTVAEAAASLEANENLLEVLCNTILAIGVLTKNDGAYALTPAGGEIVDQLGYFTWAVGGYGQMLLNLSGLTSGELIFDHDITRNDRYVAQGAGEVGQRYVWPLIRDVLGNVSFDVIADLGCGSADLLINICTSFPHAFGLGIDISTSACRLAQDKIIRLGLEDRITVIQADVLDLIDESDFEQRDLLDRADVVSSFFMLHDLMKSKIQSQEMLKKLEHAFPNASHFLFGDTMKSDSPEQLHQQQIFSLAFELTHAFMTQRIWEKQYYDDLFAACNLHIERCIRMSIPFSWLYVLKPESKKEER